MRREDVQATLLVVPALLAMVIAAWSLGFLAGVNSTGGDLPLCQENEYTETTETTP